MAKQVVPVKEVDRRVGCQVSVLSRKNMVGNRQSYSEEAAQTVERGSLRKRRGSEGPA